MKFTPGEWRDLQKGFETKQRTEQRNIAWAVANLMNATGNFKKAVTVESLLKEPEKQNRQPGRKITAEEMEAMKRRFGG